MFGTGAVTDATALYQHYHRSVYAYLLRLTGEPHAAEDLLQETFFRAIRGAAGYRGDATPLTWLCVIARRLWATSMRRAARERDRSSAEALDRIYDPRPGPEQWLLGAEQRAAIVLTLAALPEQQRLALLLRDWDGLPYETIAEILGLSLANVKVTIHRARVRFRAGYAAERSDDDGHA